MKKQSLFNRAVKITAVSMLTFCLFFNIEIDLEVGKFGLPSFNSISFGNVVFAQDEVDAPELDGGTKVAEDCKHTGYYRDKCEYGFYLISNCRKKRTIMEASDCGYNP